MTLSDPQTVWFRRVGGMLSLAHNRAAHLSILIFHRVLAAPDPMYPWVVDVSRFRWQMQVLAEFFNVLPLSEAVERLRYQQLPPRAACVTFDDGYADNAKLAVPILRELGLSATFFIASGFLDGGRMWNDTVVESIRCMPGDTLDLDTLQLGHFRLDTLAARISSMETLLQRLKYLPLSQRLEYCQVIAELAGLEAQPELMMCSADVRQLVNVGMEVGGHTINHPILAILDDKTARREIADNRDRLQALTGGPVPLFAYPNGTFGVDFLPEHIQMVQDLGFRGAVTNHWGACTYQTQPWQLPRFTPWDQTPLRFLARLQLNTWRTSSVSMNESGSVK